MANDGTQQWKRSQNARTAGPVIQPRKLTPAQIDDIRARRAEGENPRDLALEYGVTAGVIRTYAPPPRKDRKP